MSRLIEDKYNQWKQQVNERFYQLKANEEELNRLFIDIYGLQDELTPEVSDKDVSVTKVLDTKNDMYDDLRNNQYVKYQEDVIKDLISYAVGCMFGRYSVDVEGLIYAGGEFDHHYKNKQIFDGEDWIETTIEVVPDNILIITDQQYFETDIVTRFVDFIERVYGSDTLEMNLNFIVHSLYPRKSESARDLLREYFVKDFYKDHVKRYQKRPIYWLFKSGRYNAVQILVYLHRYNRDLIGTIRTNYIFSLQSKLDSELNSIDKELESNQVVKAAELRRYSDLLRQQILELKNYEELIHNFADQRIDLDLDDGIKVNYQKFGKLLAKI